MHQVLAVDKGSLAARYGIRAGDRIRSINGEPLIDAIDYQALTAVRHVCLVVERPDGSSREVDIIKPAHAPLGMQFEDSLVCDPRSCANNCVFCFIDQMPPNMRKSLYVKDDDWRLSLMMGNFVTLTNVGEREFERIIKRRVSPLYVSVHSTDPELRSRLMRQKRAAGLMPRLERLKTEGLHFHAQVVLCPGLNDGAALEQTLNDLLAFHPSALSVALVPVGLTKYREGLTDIQPYTADQARELLAICAKYQAIALEKTGRRFVYPADELICLAGAELPSAESYDGYPQIENGVGLIRQFEDQLVRAADSEAVATAVGDYPRIALACGTSIAHIMRGWVQRFAPRPDRVYVHPIRNDFFGHTVTVSGLIVGLDLVQQMQGVQADLLLLPDSMLNADRTLFLDDLPYKDLSDILGIKAQALPCHGEALWQALRDPWTYLRTDSAMKEQA